MVVGTSKAEEHLAGRLLTEGATEGMPSFELLRCLSLKNALGQGFSNSEVKGRLIISFVWGRICGPWSFLVVLWLGLRAFSIAAWV